MTSRISVPSLAVLAFLLGTAGACAQSVDPDEAITPDGAAGSQFALTPAQKSAIYNAVMHARVRTTAAIPVAIGAPVSPAVELAELPSAATSGDPTDFSPSILKYALVDGDVVVVDPVKLRVVDIIHSGTRP